VTPLAVAEAAARAAGRALVEGFGSALTVERKGAIDLVTSMDRAAEKILVERIRASFPDHEILAEEGGGRALAADGRPRWILDPLDGTTNYAHAHPQWCVSVGFAEGDRAEAGVVFDPLRDELFAAARGQGASLAGRPIRVSAVRTLDDALIATGFPYDRRERADFYMAFYRAAVIATQGVRRAGAAALDLAWTACGRLDAYFEFGVKPWDLAAGTLLVEEAGGTVSDLKGAPLRLDAGQVLVSNGPLHREMLALIAKAWP
jgi:myo-inositol-1(or 4)-monophosphatase